MMLVSEVSLFIARGRICQSIASKYCLFWVFSFELLLKLFRMCLLGTGFYTLIKNVLFPSLTDVGSHNTLPSGPAFSLALGPLSNRCGISQSIILHGLASSLVLVHLSN